MDVRALFLALVMLVTLSSNNAHTAPAATSFFAPFDSHDSALWQRSDGWNNGFPFWNGWRADHATFADGALHLRLDDQPCPSGCSSMPYASGEYSTKGFYGYGRIEGRMRVVAGSGTVASLFTYTGPSDGNPQHEIDIEILGQAPTQLQTNYYTDGVGEHESIIELGFDASADFHTYAFEWLPDHITWFVDGVPVHTEDGSRGPLPSIDGRIMMNLWPTTGVDSWTGPFTYTTPLTASYDWVRYTSLADLHPDQQAFIPLLWR